MFEFSSDQMYPYNLSRPMPMPMPMPMPAAGVGHRWKPNVEIAPNCPRCDSSNTKFCYYNNYSLTQPRYFCKGCRRYWTKGGSLRNVPVGGGCRKNRRAKSARSSLPSDHTSSAASRRTSASDSLRPDLALDDMVGCSNQPTDDASSSTTNVPNIDLAILYSRFLNHEQQQPPRTDDDDDQGLAVPADQLLHDLVGSSSAGSDQAGFMGDQFGYGFDPNGTTSYESLPLDPTAADQATDAFSTDDSHQLFQNFPWQAPEQFLQAAGFCPASDVDISGHLHHHDLIGNDWCTPIDQSSFGAF